MVIYSPIHHCSLKTISISTWLYIDVAECGCESTVGVVIGVVGILVGIVVGVSGLIAAFIIVRNQKYEDGIIIARCSCSSLKVLLSAHSISIDQNQRLNTVKHMYQLTATQPMVSVSHHSLPQI